MYVSYIELSLVYNHLRISSCPWPSTKWVSWIGSCASIESLYLLCSNYVQHRVPGRLFHADTAASLIIFTVWEVCTYSIHSDVIIRPSSVQWPLRFCPATNHRTWLSLYFLFHLWGNTNNVCHSRKERTRTCMHESGYLSSYRWQDRRQDIILRRNIQSRK